MKTELKERFSMAEELRPPELWAEARRRAAAPEAPPRALEWPPAHARRLVAGAVAFAVFAAAVVFAWGLARPDRPPAPRPAPPAVDLAAELGPGWTEFPPPPEVRQGAATSWTGSELLVWGGFVYDGAGDETPADDGFVFDPTSRSWRTLPDGPLSARSHAATAWTGSELLVWGGYSGYCCVPSEMFLGDGAAFDPTTGSWRMLPPAPIDARAPFSVWTGSELVVWGSGDRTIRLRDGAAYDPSSDSWRAIADAPIEITDGSAVWTGDEMVVFGAALDGNNHADTETDIGAAYDPVSDSWRRIPDSTLSPQAATASWVGDEMIAWDYDQASAAYDPVADAWRLLEDAPIPFSECRPESVAIPGAVLGEFCGRVVLFTAQADRWREVTRPEMLGWVVEQAAAGTAFLVMAHSLELSQASDRTFDAKMFAYVPSDPPGGVQFPAFRPEAHFVGDEYRMPLVFPDGTQATLVFASELGLEEMGVQPDVTYLFQGRYQGSILFLLGRDAPIDDFVDTTQGRLVNTSAGGIEVWPAKPNERLKMRAWIRFELPTWSVLVPVQNPADAATIAASLDLRESPTGFPFVVATGEAELARGFGEAGGPELTFGDSRPESDTVSQLEATIFLGLSDCAGFETEVGADYGAVCLGEGKVFASINGTRDNEFVARVIEGIRIEDFRAA